MADQAQLHTTLITGHVFTLDVLKVYGASEPDKVSKFGVTHEMLDGSITEQIAGGRRDMTIEFQVMSLLNRRNLVKWWLDPDRLLQSLIAAPTLEAITATSGGGMTNGVTYSYKVVAVDVIGHGPASNEVSVAISNPNNTVPLNWNAITTARYYKIYRKNAGELGGAYGFLDYSLTNSYTDANAIAEIAGTVPSANASISVITEGELVFDWGHETELARMLTLPLRDASIFTATNGFQSVE
jgi:hypothetical protein